MVATPLYLTLAYTLQKMAPISRSRLVKALEKQGAKHKDEIEKLIDAFILCGAIKFEKKSLNFTLVDNWRYLYLEAFWAQWELICFYLV